MLLEKYFCLNELEYRVPFRGFCSARNELVTQAEEIRRDSKRTHVNHREILHMVSGFGGVGEAGFRQS